MDGEIETVLQTIQRALYKFEARAHPHTHIQHSDSHRVTYTRSPCLGVDGFNLLHAHVLGIPDARNSRNIRDATRP
jgi:hypothetical protein